MPKNNSNAWQPTISFATLGLRGTLLTKIRQFFTERGVLEVDTPLLSHATVTDPHLHSFTTQCQLPGQATAQTFYLQTSPEFAMKRLLAAGLPAIYQICKAFRQDESGKNHNPEFTLLEWYRCGFNYHQLMDEVSDLLRLTLPTTTPDRMTYAQLFQQFLQLDPHTATLAELQHCAEQQGIVAPQLAQAERDTWLQLLLSHCIEPQLAPDKPLFVYDFPAAQAALAKIRPDPVPVAERFEVYFKGLELANGFQELTDSTEQRARFNADLAQRERLGLSKVPIDERLLAALNHGLPDCAGVALGFDRLLMLANRLPHIQDVITFPLDRA